MKKIMHRKFRKFIGFSSVSMLLLLSGCQLVSVKNQSLSATITNERDSILSGKRLSEASLNVLSLMGYDPKACTDEPDHCVAELIHLNQIQDEMLFSTASEIYLSKAKLLEESSECQGNTILRHLTEKSKQEEQNKQQHCLEQELYMLDKSLRYSYVYLFYTQREPKERIFNNRQVQVRDFYNQSIAKIVQAYTKQHEINASLKEFKIGKTIYKINHDYSQLQPTDQIQSLMPTYNLGFSGLRSIIRRDGFGSEFLMVTTENNKNKLSDKSKYILDPYHYQYAEGVNPNIHTAHYLAVTVVAQPTQAKTVFDILNGSDFELNFFNPYKHDSVKIEQMTYPLAANFSAPYGLWLAENNLNKAAYLTLIDRTDHLTMPHLFMLEPYNPNKKVIVLVHGLASSPETWARLTNDIMADSVLRDHYQVWQVFYSTNMPIFESTYQVKAIINQTFDLVGKNDSAQNDAVVIGHSMGGLLSRLFVSRADLTETAMKKMNKQNHAKFQQDSLLKARVQIEPIPHFSRAIFLSTPHRGTAYADRWFTLAARRIIKLPVAFVTTFTDTLQGEIEIGEFGNEIKQSLIQNGPSDLSKNSAFIDLTSDVMPIEKVKYHSLIGNNTNSTDPNLMSDGIVPYQSSHLTGAVSEKIIQGGHSIQDTPQAVIELRRILRQHLQELGIFTPNPNLSKITTTLHETSNE